MGITGLTQCWQTCSALRWPLGARRDIPWWYLLQHWRLLLHHLNLNQNIWAGQCDVLTNFWRHHRPAEGCKGPSCLPPTVPGELRSSWKSYRTLMNIFSHLKDSKLMLYRGRFSAEIEQIGNLSVSLRPWPCLTLLLAPRKSLIPKEANGKGEWDFSPATGV